MATFPWLSAFARLRNGSRVRLGVTPLDDRLTPAAIVAVPAATGETPIISVYDSATMAQRYTVTPYETTFTGGVSVAIGDVTGDGQPDVITGAGLGGSPTVNVFDGNDGTLLKTFTAGDASSTGGVNVSVADFDADGTADIVAGTVRGGAALVQVLRYADTSVIREFSPGTGATAPSVAAGDANFDGTPDVFVGAGAGGNPRVIVYDGSDAATLMDFLAFEATFTGGVRVSAGDLNADGAADVITTAGDLGGPRVQAFDGQTRAVLLNFFAYDSGLRGGVYASAADTDGDGTLELQTSNGTGQAANPKAFSPTTLAALSPPATARQAVGGAFDTTAPTATVAAAVAATDVGPLAFTVEFAEAVNGFTEAGLRVANGTVAGFTRNSAANYGVTVTPTGEGAVTVGLAAGAAFDPAGNTNAAVTGASSAYDTTDPTVTINALTAASTTPTLTGTVSETAAVTVTVNGQTIRATVSGTTWTAAVPTALADGVYAVTATATDAAGNSGAATLAAGLTVDTVAPTATITSDERASTAKNPIPFTVTFDEDVTGFVVADVTVSNGAVMAFTAVDARTYTLSVVPNTAGTVSVAVAAAVATDAGGLGNAAAVAVGREFTGTVTAAAVTADVTGTTNVATATVTVRFADAVTGFTIEDVVVTNGTATNFTAVGDGTYTVTVTPSADGAVTVTVPAGAATDPAGNPTAGGTFAFTSDRGGPTATLTSTLAAVNTATITYTVTFDEDVSDFTAADLTVTNGTVTAVTAEDARTYRVTVTPTANGAVTVTVNAGTATDALGNPSAAAGPVTVTYDTAAPTAVVTGTDATVSGPMSFTVTFGEDVTGVAVGDFTATNGTVTAVSAVSASVYSVSVTPAGAGTVTLTAGTAADAAGNTVGTAAGSATATAETNSAGLSTTIPNVTDGGWVVSETGLETRDVIVGSGDAVTAGQTVTVHYTGWLLDGTQFDSSTTTGTTATFSLDGVIAGWRDGLVGMKPGGVRDLYIPADLAYGASGSGSIPANATLVFQVKLVASTD